MAASFKIFAAILFVTETERQAVMDMFDWKPFRPESGGRIWFKTTVERGSNPLTIIAAQTEEKGNPAAAALTSEIIHLFRPQYLFMVGIAAGVQFTHKEKQPELCDVVLADRVWNLAKGKYTSAEGPAIGLKEDQGFIPRPVVHKIDQSFRNTLKTAIKEWKSDIPVHIGAFASGSAVVANAKVISENVLPIIEKTKGLDMESYGVVYTALHASSPRPQPILAKGISDFADKAKSDDCQVRAATNSCELAKYLIKTLPMRDDEKSLIDYISMRLIDSKDGHDKSLSIRPKRMWLYSLGVWVAIMAVMLLSKAGLVSMGITTVGIGLLGYSGVLLLKKADRILNRRLQDECSNVERNTRLHIAGQMRKQLETRSYAGGQIDIAGRMVPGAVSVNDMYSWYASDDRHLWLFVSDATGNDIDAAGFLSRTAAGIRSMCMAGTALEDIAEITNRLLCEGNSKHQILNAIIGSLDLETLVFRFVNAGESKHFIKSPGCKAVQLATSDCKTFGLDPEATFPVREVQLSKGDLLLLCSSGVTTIRNNDGEMFGPWRVDRYLSSLSDESSSDIIDGLREDILTFTEKQPREQDFTILALKC